MKLPDQCPHCQYWLNPGDIYMLYLQDGKSPEKALTSPIMHGGKEEEPTRFNKIVALYDINLDRTTGYFCPKCENKITND